MQGDHNQNIMLFYVHDGAMELTLGGEEMLAVFWKSRPFKLLASRFRFLLTLNDRFHCQVLPRTSSPFTSSSTPSLSMPYIFRHGAKKPVCVPGVGGLYSSPRVRFR